MLDPPVYEEVAAAEEGVGERDWIRFTLEVELLNELVVDDL